MNVELNAAKRLLAISTNEVTLARKLVETFDSIFGAHKEVKSKGVKGIKHAEIKLTWKMPFNRELNWGADLLFRDDGSTFVYIGLQYKVDFPVYIDFDAKDIKRTYSKLKSEIKYYTSRCDKYLHSSEEHTTIQIKEVKGIKALFTKILSKLP